MLLPCPLMLRWLPARPTDWQHCCRRDWRSLPTWLSTSWNRAGAECADEQITSYARAGEDQFTLKTLKSRAGEHSQCGSPVPPCRGGLGLLVGSSTPQCQAGWAAGRAAQPGSPQATASAMHKPALQSTKRDHVRTSFCFSETTDFRSHLCFLCPLLSKLYCSGSLHLSSLSSARARPGAVL